MTDLDLTGRTALVTGGAQGLGEGMAQALAAAGARVVVADLQDDLGEKVADSLKGDGHGFVHLDVTDEAQLGERRDGGRLRLRRARHPGQQRRRRDHQPDRRRRPEGHPHHARGQRPRHGARASSGACARCGPTASAGKGGSIINISSVAATIAFPGIPIYSATKSAVDRLTRVAAMESGKLGYGVRVNCIYPGLVPTAMGQGLAVDMAAARPVRLARGGRRRGHRAHPLGSPRRGRRHGRRRGLPGLRRVPLRQRRRPAGRRRDGDVTMTDKPVIVYGASGYTGRLICEYLREYHVPFVAAGRDGGKLKTSMESNVAGIETADYEVVEVDPRRRVADRAVHAAPRSSATPSARSASAGPRSSRPAWPPASTTSTPPASRTG